MAACRKVRAQLYRQAKRSRCIVDLEKRIFLHLALGYQTAKAELSGSAFAADRA
jgi:hypothetical protein